MFVCVCVLVKQVGGQFMMCALAVNAQFVESGDVDVGDVRLLDLEIICSS